MTCFINALFAGVCVMAVTAAAVEVKPGGDLQAVLNRGEDLELQKGAVYELSAALRYKKTGQKIYTKDARFPSEYATLKWVNPDEVTMVNGYGVDETVLDSVICDGNRYTLGVRPYPDGKKVHQPGIANLGGADDQVVRNCVFMNARGFSNIVFHRGGVRPLIENNMVLGAGVDVRGNGREANEPPHRWSDGVSCAAPQALVRNNLILDPTDVGIVFYGAPGSVAESNVVASVSRESLGGINLVDGFEWLAINEEKNLFDYRGTTVRDNTIDAYGARIHVGIPVGAAIWVASYEGRILTGGVVTGNTIAGEAAAYGIVAHGITNFTISGNTSTATYSGLYEYGPRKNPPEDPAPFLYDAASVVDTALQPDFVESKRHLKHLLRTHRAPKNELGYTLHDYGIPEVQAIVRAAYLEMLGRAPDAAEMQRAVAALYRKELNADGLRREIMAGKEFRKRFGNVPPEDLHPWRVKRWFDIVDSIIRENGKMPSALELYNEALVRLASAE